MPKSLEDQIAELHGSMDGLEAQRGTLGDAVVEPALEALRQQLAVLEQQAQREPSPAEERRLVTILFIDMVGSTSIAAKLDPEEWRQLLRIFHSALGDAVTAHRGEVAQYLGDGLLAFFGSKQASETDPENAIRAALDGQVAAAKALSSANVQLRAGIHTGLVVLGEMGQDGHKEFTASGDAMNVAARLQSAAPPNGILISHDTYRYVRGVFDLTPCPPLTIKGKGEPVKTYLVRRAKTRPFRSVARGVAGVETRTIGREAEMRTLQTAYLRAYEGHGTVWVQLMSDPGIGKSRLMTDMADWMDLREETYRLLRGRAFADDANQPFALVRRLWFDRFQIADDTPLPQAEARWLEHFTELSGQDDVDESAHALGLLVGLPFAESPYIRAMRNDPEQIKGRALVVSRELIHAIRRDEPVVLLLEDLQCADPASWEYLMEVFLRSGKGEEPNGLFILAASRPEWHPPDELQALFADSTERAAATNTWGTVVPLAPLNDRATRELARELLQRVTEVPEQIMDLLVERSAGVPYFAEEMVNWFIDYGILDTQSEEWRFLPERLKQEPLPSTLQHLLLTRLSSLTQPERAALQRGAIFGRRFWTGGVEALGASRGEQTLVELQPRGFVEAQPESAFEGSTEWSFHQALFREVTYESLLKRERAALHKVAAGWLEAQARQAGRLDEFAGLLGDHCEHAGDLSEAADWYLRAGKRAMAQGAAREAQRFCARALDLLPPIDRDRRWAALLGSEEALTVLGEAEPHKALLAALLELAQEVGDDNYLAEAHLRQAMFGMQLGDPPTVDDASREALAAARRCGNEEIEAKALAIKSVADINRRDKPAALESIEQALRLARGLGDESVLAHILLRGAFCYGEWGDFSRSLDLYVEQTDLDHRLGNRMQEAQGLGNTGATYLAVGLYREARSVLEQARAIAEALGARRLLAYDLANLGEACLATGDLRRAQEYVERALQEGPHIQDIRGICFSQVDLGRILLGMRDASGAARRFTEAAGLASEHGLAAQACEATCGVAACAIAQGQLDEARRQVNKAWDYLRENGWTGVNSPGWVYLMCAEIFDGLGEVQQSRDVLEHGHRALLEVVDTINVPSWRQSCLENVPEHRALVEMWERKKDA